MHFCFAETDVTHIYSAGKGSTQRQTREYMEAGTQGSLQRQTREHAEAGKGARRGRREHYSLLFNKKIYIYTYIPPPQTTTTQCKLLERKQSICASGWKEKDHQRKLQQVTPPPAQGVFAPMAEGKTQPAQVAASDHHNLCTGVLALVDRRITPQAQGAKVRAQGATVRAQGAKVKANISSQ